MHNHDAPGKNLTVQFVFEEYPPGNPWRERSLETRLRNLELTE